MTFPIVLSPMGSGWNGSSENAGSSREARISYRGGFLGRADGQEPRNEPKGTPDASVERLADEVRGKGWIVFSARSERGDWDLFACRPDGSERRNITNTPDFNEAAAQFSRDGRRLLFRRLPREEPINGNHYGTQGELIIASADGSGQRPFGAQGEYPWASWSPDGEQLACLAIKGISIVDVNTRGVVRTLPRKGFFQQLTWSPDGRWLSGVSNSFGASWSVGPDGDRHGSGQRDQRCRLLHARLVSREPHGHLFESSRGPEGEQRGRLDAALDGGR